MTSTSDDVLATPSDHAPAIRGDDFSGDPRCYAPAISSVDAPLTSDSDAPIIPEEVGVDLVTSGNNSPGSGWQWHLGTLWVDFEHTAFLH